MRKNRGSWRREKPWTPKQRRICPNCRKQTLHGHYAPPSLGEPGFWMCDQFKEPTDAD